ncbi:hypothetical protein Tco_0546347 [Tanacetum coccineum]
MNDPNVTMEEYIKLEEEKACRRGRMFNWETATYGKIGVDDDLHDLRYVEAEFPAIVIDDAFAPQDALPCKSQVSTPVNDEIDFRISFDESDDEDYTIICNKNSFSYKMISVNNLKTDSENDNEKAAIVYNDAQTSKSDYLTEPILNPQHVDEFDLNDETSLFEYDEEEQNVLDFNDLFPFNMIHPDYLKSDKDNDNNKIDIIQSSEDMAPLPPHEQRHPFLRYQSLEYTDVDIADFEERRPLVKELILEFISTLQFGEVLLDLDALDTIKFQLGRARRRLSWRQFILALGLHIGEEIESLVLLGPPPFYTLIRDPVLRLCHRMMAHSIAGRSQAPEKVTMTDMFYLRGLDVGSVNIPYLLARYLRRFAVRRKSGAHISGGQFVARLAEHFGLLTAEILGGLTEQIDDTWAWVAIGLERQSDAAAGAPRVALDTPIVDKGGQADLAPAQAPPPPLAAGRTMP